jgi:nitrate/nitrite transporter NarK
MKAQPASRSARATGSPGPRQTRALIAALWAFLIFYVSCLVITWQVYTRRGGLLYAVERGSSKPDLKAATA